MTVRLALRATWRAVALLAASHCVFAESSAPRGRFGTSVGELAFPSVGRIAFGFLLTAILAITVVFVLSKLRSLFLKRQSVTTAVRVLDRTAVSRTLTVHLLDVQGTRVLVAEGRNGVHIERVPEPVTAPVE